MVTLVPTVHERLARCGERIYVDGLVAGADVVVSVNGTEHTFTASGGGFNLTVPPLDADAVVKAKQDTGGGFTPWSPDVVVEDALVPPNAGPHLPQQVGACSHCLLVWGMVPGCRVEVLFEANVVGEGTADRGGAACVGINLDRLKGEAFGAVRARMIVCGATGPESASPVVPEPALPKPAVGSPVFGCQRVIPLSNLHPGSRVRAEMDGTNLGSFCSCWTAVNLHVGTDLVTTESVRAQPFWEGAGCKDDGPWSEWEPVVPPDERIKPEVLPVLVDGDQVIRVGNQVVGATLMVRVRPDAAQPFEEFGPRPASQEPEIALNAPLATGNVVTVVQTLCGVSFESDPVTVQPKPPVIFPPAVVPPLFACGGSVQVSGLHPGAYVRVFADAIPIGTRWAGDQPSVAVSANLVAGTKITATQKVGGTESDPSDPAVLVEEPRLAEPRVMMPVAEGETSVWVSSVTPGAHVAVWSGTTLLGEADASEPIVRVGVSPVPASVHATARLCERQTTGNAVEPIADPCGPGLFPDAADDLFTYADFPVPAAADGDAFDSRIEGQLYLPSDDGKSWHRDARNLPLVVIAHGYWKPEIQSYLGYDYLARHLARWGMVVFSLNMDDVNNESHDPSRPHQFARGEIILHAIDELLADPDLEGRIDRDRIGLIGHSMGGEGVVMAQRLNEADGRGYGIRGVVSIAPTQYRTEVALRQSNYLQLFGSMDLLAQSLPSSDQFNGFKIYDRAWRPKTHAWIHGARHNPFNRVWVADGDTFESGWADIALPPADHERIARCLINAFFQDALRGQSAYAGYMEGMILPPSLRILEIHIQHSREPRTVVDNFGDLDEQEPLAAEALDKTSNSLGQVADASGAGIGIWEDVDHTALARSPHETKGVELSWSEPDATYTSDTGGLAVDIADVVALRVGQFYQDATLNTVDIVADLFVTLDDGADQATVRAGAAALIPYPDTRANPLCPMRTIRIPADAFTAANPALSLGNVDRVTLRLAARPTGHILVDDLEIGR